MLNLDNDCQMQKVKYFRQFFPATLIEPITGKSFLDLYQTNKDKTPKGIVAIDLRNWQH